MDLVIAVDDPGAEDVRALLERHLTFSRRASPPCHDHALDAGGLAHESVTFFSARRDGVLVGVGALRELDATHGEVKSMHTVEAFRGQGVGRAVLEHLLAVAAGRGYRRVSLETGSQDAFTPARSLYARGGFRPCEPFGEYTFTPHSTYMTIALGA